VVILPSYVSIYPEEEMSLKRKYIYVLAICLSIIVAGAIIAYNPFREKMDETIFKFPAGIPPSLGIGYATSLGDADVNSIQVSGQGSVSAKATQATLTLGAWTDNPVAAKAVEENALLMTSVIDAITGLGIAEDKVKTVTYSVNTNYDWETRSVKGYQVTNMIQITVEDINMVGEVIDLTAAAGANNIQGISFGISDQEAKDLANNAYVLALQNAREKAELIANTLDLEITDVLYVSESSFAPYSPYRGNVEMAMDSRSSVPTPIIEGSLSVSVNVQIAFSIQ
jgi:hypothetical protein